MAVSFIREAPPRALLLLRVRCELDQKAEYLLRVDEEFA
jgi:hypothetical protein